MEWLQIAVLLLGSTALGFAGFKLYGAGYRTKKVPASLTTNKADALSLTAIGNERWKKNAAASALTTPFLQRGFMDGGCYTVREAPGTILQFLVMEAEGILVTVFEDAKATHWVEIATYYEDGTEWVYATREGDTSLHRPGCTRYYAPRLTPEVLYGKLRQERLKKKLRKLTIHNVDFEYTQMWTAHQKWLKETGRV